MKARRRGMFREKDEKKNKKLGEIDERKKEKKA